MLCKIQSDTLTAIANQTRRLTGTSAPLSPAQMATALSGVSVNAGGGGEPCDSFKFCDFDEHPTDYGVNGTDGHGNALTPYTVLDYLPTYSISPPSTSITNIWINGDYHTSILDKFANLIPGRTISNNKYILAEITMPALTSIGEYSLWDCVNLASAHFPSCMSICYETFYRTFYREGLGVIPLETLTLNSACVIPEGAFTNVLAPDSKAFRLYLRGNSMGTCSDAAFYVYETDDNTNLYVDAHDKYGQTIPGLEIYVPANLLNDFKTTWAGGAFANNIYALTD